MTSLSAHVLSRCSLFFALGQFRIADGPVASFMLGGIEGSVGGLDQVALKPGIAIVDRHTHTDSEMLNRVRRAGKKLCLLHRPPQALSDVQGGGFAGFGQDNDELLAPIPGYSVDLAHVL